MAGPALALLELDSVAAGILAADRMVKRAPFAMWKAGTVHPGRFLILLGGTVASVEEAWREGVESAGSLLVDEVFLPDADPGLHAALLGTRQEITEEALGVLETRGVAALLRATDAAVKGASVRIAELRLADDLGGRAFVLFDGGLNDVQAALEIGGGRVSPAAVVHSGIVPRLDGNLRRLLAETTRFGACPELEPDGAERE